MNMEQIQQEGARIKQEMSGIADPEELSRIFTEKGNDDRYCFHLARNRNTPVKVLEEIFGKYQKDEVVMEQMVANPNCPEEIVARLLEIWKASDLLKRNALSNPNCPKDHLFTTIRQMIKSEDPFYLRPIFENSDLPAELIAEIAALDDLDAILKRKIYQHRNTPEAIRNKLKPQA